MDMIEHGRLWVANERGYFCVICRKGEWAKVAAGNVPSDLVLYHAEAGVVHPDFDLNNASVNDLSLRCVRCSQHKLITKEAFVPDPGPNQSFSRWKGFVWINDGKTTIRIESGALDQKLSEGWKRGRLLKKVHLESHKGMIRITNGVSNRIVDKDFDIPTGWWKGRSMKPTSSD